MSKRTIKLSESDIKKHIKSVISEQPNTNRQQGQFGGQRQRGQGQIPPPQNQTPPPQRGFRVDPSKDLRQNVQSREIQLGRRLQPQEIQQIVTMLRGVQRQRTQRRTTTPTVDKNDLAGIDKGEGLNLYGNEAQTILQHSATIDKIVKSGSGFDIFVSGDYTFRDKY